MNTHQLLSRLAPLLGIACWVASAPPIAAQAPPGTDIFLVSVRVSDAGWTLGQPEPVTDRDGYDNQPAFVDRGRALLYTSIDDDGQAEIRRFELATRTDRAVTATAESEYSPTATPDGGLSVVRVEADGRQRLWRFAFDGKAAPTLLLPDVAPVGYHAWIDDRRLVLFVLGEPPTLQLATVGGDAPTVLAEDIGRALARIPGRDAMSFVHKTDDGWWLTAYEPSTGSLERLIRTRPEREDYAWAPDGSVWMADGSTLYRWQPTSDDDWQVVGTVPLDGLTRLAFHPSGDRLAVVADRPAADAAPDDESP